MLILGVGYLLAERSRMPKPAAPSATTSAALPAPAATAPEAVTDKSVAVLPFADMSEKKDQEYFSDGLAEELIEQLGRTPGLKVIARTSSFSFKGKALYNDKRTVAGPDFHTAIFGFQRIL
ncbi:MAG: hypothetical protein ABSG30_04915 [Steroidobacteraceae bacterium]